MNKQVKVEDNYNVINWAKKYNINNRAFFIIGFPGETKETLEEVTACCLIENIGSTKLLTKLNFTELNRDSTMIYWSLLRENKLS